MSDPFRPQRPPPGRPFRPPFVEPSEPVRETASLAFGDLVRLLAEGIADGQAALDRAAAELVGELAQTRVSIVPRLDETINPDGTVTFTQAPPQQVSLLDLGITPTFYQFSQATVEVVMDLKVVENSTLSGDGRPRFGLFADTANLRFERKLNREVTVSSKLTATLVPVPAPLRLEPVRVTTTPEPAPGPPPGPTPRPIPQPTPSPAPQPQPQPQPPTRPRPGTGETPGPLPPREEAPSA